MQLQDFERDYYELLQSDMLEQFKGSDKINTNALLRALAAQLDDLLKANKELVTKTNINDAEGVQLDGCGDIVKLTRAEAGMFSPEVTANLTEIGLLDLASMGVTTPMDLLKKHAESGIIPFIVTDDERYRELLNFKVFLNSNHCTQPDVMKVIKMFWKRSGVSFSEDVVIGGKRYHATILLDAGELSPEDNARVFFLVPVIKAAGVQIIRKANTRSPMQGDDIRVKGIIPGTIMRTRLPPLEEV